MDNELYTNTINRETFTHALKEREQREDLTLLVVEDQKFSRLLLKNALAKNYDVIDVADGERALAEYVTHAPNIVFLDIELPGVGGHKVRELLVKLDQEAYIVMVTANNHPSDVEKAIQGGARGFIAKPYTKEKIFECIDNYLIEKQKQQI